MWKHIFRQAKSLFEKLKPKSRGSGNLTIEIQPQIEASEFIRARADADATRSKAKADADTARMHARAQARATSGWMKGLQNLITEFGRLFGALAEAYATGKTARTAAATARHDSRAEAYCARSERREQYWTRIIGEWSEFWERWFKAAAEWYERRKQAKAEYVRTKQAARKEAWTERRKTFVRLFRTFRTEFARTITFIQDVLRRNPDLFRKFTAKISKSPMLLLALIFLIAVGLMFNYPRLWKLALIILIIVLLYRYRREFSIRRLKARWMLFQRHKTHRPAKQRNKTVSWGFAFKLAMVNAALLVFAFIIGGTLGVWIKAFASVGIAWSFALPLITSKTFLARFASLMIIILPSTAGMCIWLVIRLKG